MEADQTLTRGRATAGLDVSWPLIRRLTNGADLILEPMAQLSASTDADLDPHHARYEETLWRSRTDVALVGVMLSGLGVVGGAFNGYPRAFHGGWFPAVIPVTTWTSGAVGIDLALVPPLANRLYGAVSLQIKLRWPPS